MENNGDQKRQLTNGPTSEWHPRWSPDGKWILYISDRETEIDQVWRMGANGGESRPVTRISTGVSGFEFFPDSERLLVESSVYPDCHSDSCNVARDSLAGKEESKGVLYDRLLYRHYNRWDDGRVNRLFVFDLSTAIYRELYDGPHDAPTALLGGDDDYAISPDGDEVCFAMHTDSVPAIWPNNDLFIIPSAGGVPTRITSSTGLDTSPQYSPDGRYIAYRSQARAGYESDQSDLVLYDRKSGTHANLTAAFDRSVDEFQWAPKARDVYFLAIERGFSKVWRLDITSGRIELLLDDGVYGNLAISPDEMFFAVSYSLSDKPSELYRMGIKSLGWLQLTDFADKAVLEIDMNRAEEFWFTGALGDSVHGFITKPPRFDSTRKYPLVLLVHGGPQWCWLGDFNYYGWNTQLVAAQGYVVGQIDPHGSVGYGLKFQEYVSGNWGKGDYEDLMKGVDYLIHTCPFIDSTRMAALGRSYGGYMVDWICGHTDRFACLISIDGSCNEVSAYGSTEELWFPEWEFRGTPYDNWEEYIRSSPITYAASFKTPTMLIHGGNDYRVDLSEGLQMFTALQRQGVPSQLLYFPDEGHNVGKTQNLRYAYAKQFEWLARWLRP